MEFHCEVGVEDLVAFNVDVAARLRVRGVDWHRILVCLGPAALLGWAFWRESGGLSLLLAGAIATVVYLEWPAVQRSMLERSIRRIHAVDTDSSALGAQEHRLTDVGIESKFATGHSLYHWASIIDIAETETHLFIYLSPVKAIIVPKNSSLRGATASEIVAAVRNSVTAHA